MFFLSWFVWHIFTKGFSFFYLLEVTEYSSKSEVETGSEIKVRPEPRSSSQNSKYFVCIGNWGCFINCFSLFHKWTPYARQWLNFIKSFVGFAIRTFWNNLRLKAHEKKVFIYPVRENQAIFLVSISKYVHKCIWIYTQNETFAWINFSTFCRYELLQIVCDSAHKYMFQPEPQASPT